MLGTCSRHVPRPRLAPRITRCARAPNWLSPIPASRVGGELLPASRRSRDGGGSPSENKTSPPPRGAEYLGSDPGARIGSAQALPGPGCPGPGRPGPDRPGPGPPDPAALGPLSRPRPALSPAARTGLPWARPPGPGRPGPGWPGPGSRRRLPLERPTRRASAKWTPTCRASKAV